MLELNSRLQTSHRGFSRFTERLVAFLAAAAVHAATRVVVVAELVAICESIMNWPC